MRQIQQIEKFAFSGTLHNIVYPPHGIAAIHQYEILNLSFQHCLNDRFSKPTQIGMCDFVRQFKILRHFF